MNHAKTVDIDYVGKDFDTFLADEGIAAVVDALAIKKMMVGLLTGTGLIQAELALRMQTSRTQVRRLVIGFEPGH